jgi:hypothetical protein
MHLLLALNVALPCIAVDPSQDRRRAGPQFASTNICDLSVCTAQTCEFSEGVGRSPKTEITEGNSKFSPEILDLVGSREASTTMGLGPGRLA